MFWRFVGYGKVGRTEEKLAHPVALENEHQPSEKVRRKDLGKPKFRFRREVGMSAAKVEGRWELLALHSATSPMRDGGPTACSVSPKLQLDTTSRKHSPLALFQQRVGICWCSVNTSQDGVNFLSSHCTVAHSP